MKNFIKKKHCFLLATLLCLPSLVLAEERLIFAVDIVRHGDRTPLIVSSEIEKIWSQGVGQLTPEGMRQEYELGKLLRKRYVDEQALLPRRYVTNSINVRSSDIPRTLMSAQSLLFGLYPLGTGPLPHGLQPIPIHTLPREQDGLLIPNHNKTKYKQLLEEYIFNTPEWIQRDTQLKQNYPLWSHIFGIPLHNLFDLIHASDRLYIEHLYNLPLPNGLSEEDASKITEAGKWALLKIINHPKLAADVGGELAQLIKNEMKLATEQVRPLRYLLFVAHDTTLAAQLKILGQTIDDVPPYASELNYSLFDLGGRYKIQVTYNQKPLYIAQCGGDSCSLEDFIHLIDEQ